MSTTTTSMQYLHERVSARVPVGLVKALLVFAPFVALLLLRGALPAWAVVVPSAWVPPFADWLNAAVEVLREERILGLFTFQEATRLASRVIVDGLVRIIEGALISGYSVLGLPALPWTTIAGLAAVFGWWLNGWRLALLGATPFVFFALFEWWQPAMVTFAAIAVSVPLAALIGLVLGLLADRWRPFERFLWPLLNLMQSLPHFSYLIPVAVFIGVSHRAGIIATVLFAVPPMARLTLVGLRGIPGELIEAGLMAGCTPRQMLWKVRLPAARPALLVGVNQVIMQCLAMVVIASFIGASGLGQELLFRLQNLRIGEAVEIGIAIVLMAVLLDRFGHALARKEPERLAAGPFWKRRPHITAAVAVVAVTFGAWGFTPAAHTWPEQLTVSMAPFWNGLVDYITTNFTTVIRVFHDGLLIHVLIPVRETLQQVPWSAAVVLAGAAGWALGGIRLAALIALFVLYIAFCGYWERALITVYMVLSALVFCLLVGVPIGVWGASGPRRARAIEVLCDTMQTFPSFIYLIPVIMVFRVGDVAAITAIAIYAVIPTIRYTVFGLRSVPQETIEAATMAGCTAFQTLRKVKLPLALPQMMLGLNQTLMFALFMVVIAAFIGTKDLGQEIFRALTFNDAGKGLVLGLAVAFIGLAADRLIVAWADRRRRELGLG